LIKYVGIIVEESLDDNRIINNYEVSKICITGHEKRQDRWHMYEVILTKDEILELSRHIVDGWYMHFWRGRNVIAVFKDKQFEFNFDEKETWTEVLKYGRSLGIPEAQLDFPINGL
jgi:hypothetical protein